MKVVMLGNNTKEEIKNRLQVVASAGMLSRANGTVTKVFENNNDYEKNLKLARNIIGYGHKSIAEHDYLVFAIENVTPIVEQILINYRLTSFTIKSRRNVDFRNVGSYTPDFHNDKGEILENNTELKYIYNNHMDYLFNKYGEFVDEGLPIEDSRYILPYCYFSNIIMGCDANELIRITSDLLYGKNSSITELKELGNEFKSIIEEYVPYLTKALEKEYSKKYYEDHLKFLDDYNFEQNQIIKKPKLNKYTLDGDEFVLCNILMSRYNISYDKAIELLYKNPNIQEEMIQALFKNKNQRELEQIVYSFEIPISLASLTHITRHRMHSLMIPDFVPIWNLDNYIIPPSMIVNHEKDFVDIFGYNKSVYEYFKEQGVRDEDLVYFYLSGHVFNIYTTMNARNMKWISRMRCCNKAQWEIRNLVNMMVDETKKVTPLISRGYGAYCNTEGYCPEGKDSCKNRGVVIKKKTI